MIESTFIIIIVSSRIKKTTVELRTYIKLKTIYKRDLQNDADDEK